MTKDWRVEETMKRDEDHMPAVMERKESRKGGSGAGVVVKEERLEERLEEGKQ